MHKNNIPVKVSIGYAAVAIIMVLAIALVYGNTKSIIAINQASKEYIAKKNTADSTMTSLLKEEQENLRQLSDAMAGKPDKNYLRDASQTVYILRSKRLRHRYFLVSCTITPFKSSSEMRFGIAIKALVQSDRFHTTSRFATLPANMEMMNNTR